jgi:hypothetical protein
VARNSLSARIRRYRFPELPGHYMQPKKKEPPITTSEAGKLRWKGMSAQERSEFMRQVAIKAWAERKKKRPKKSVDKKQ